MATTKEKKNEIDKYIATFPLQTQNHLKQMRATIKKAAPAADELISYKMPAYKYKGVLAYFAGFKNHIGLYALGSPQKQFKDELSMYKTGKGSIQFPLDKKLPIGLIAKIIKFRVKENDIKFELKNKKKKI